MAFTYALPVLCAFFAIIFKMRLTFSDSLLAALGILAAALITAFSQLAVWRQSLTAEGSTKKMAHEPERWLLDTSVSHLLAGAYSAIIACVLIVLTKAVTIPPDFPWLLHEVGCGLIILVTVHVVASLALALPGLYDSYVQLNNVDPLLNGQNKE
jgi:hypothetical protein